MDFKNLPRQSARIGPRPQLRLRLWGSTALAAILAVAQASPAYATINNTATATGTAPGGGTVSASSSASVDVENADPKLSIVKSAVISVDNGTAGSVDPGDTVTYTYVVKNEGNVTLVNVGVTDVPDVGVLSIVAPTSVTFDNTSPAGSGRTNDSNDSTNPGGSQWDRLGPGDTITFTATYTAVLAHFVDPDVADGTLDNVATPYGQTDPDQNLATAGTPAADISVAANKRASVPINVAPRMTVLKIADNYSNRAVGDVVTYTYTITNAGNVPITNVTLADVENGSGSLNGPAFSSWVTQGSSTMGSGLQANTITYFSPGSVAVYTSTYTVTQTDVNTLQ